MLASDFISHELPILKITDKSAQVMRWMDEYRVMHLPVFDSTEYLGILTEADLLDMDSEEDDLSVFRNKLLKVAIKGERPIYDVIKLMDDFKLSVIPVLGDDERLLGLISYKQVLTAMVAAFNLNSEGGVFVLEMNYVDYALSEISRIVESNDARVLSAHVSFQADSNLIDVTIKVNTASLTSIIQTLERYDYQIKASFHKGDDQDYLQDRYEELMRYLNT
jgi:acetoin utilization protein AcuB